MKCIDKTCKYRQSNGGDEFSDFYFCKYVGIDVDRGEDECLLDKYAKEDEVLKQNTKRKESEDK